MTVKNISKPIGIAFLIIAGILAFGFDGYGDYIWTMAALYLLVFIGLVVREYKNKDLSKGFFAEKKYVIFFAIYAFWLFISPYWSTWFDISRITVWILLLTPLGFFVSVCLTVNSNEKKLFIYSYFAVGIFLFLWANLDFFATKSRTDGPLNDSNVFAGLLVAFILPVFAFLLTFNPESKSQKRIYEYSYIYITFGMLAFFTTSSRSAT
ncbi:MAG: hypothetical protein KJO88_10220, partial [Gammaproteobacteria bacterium]|nr:hypothetical protein [Gammaproteobacteria bacterium]